MVDLACGDGRFARALIERGSIERVDLGLERSARDAADAAHRLGGPVVVGDLVAVPLGDELVGTVLCITALDCLSGGPPTLHAALAEIRRVLRAGGRLVAAVHVPAHDSMLLGVRLLRAIGLRGPARRYAARINRENTHTVHLDRAGWVAALEAAGLVVERVQPLVGLGPMRARSLLHLLKAIRPRGMARILTRRLLLGPMARLVALPSTEEEPAAFLVLVARRPGDGQRIAVA